MITKGIFSSSYDKKNNWKKIKSISAKKALIEKMKGFEGVSHVIYRPKDGFSFRGENIDLVKFHMPIAGVPMEVYTYLIALNSGIKDMVVIGNDEVKFIYDWCEKLFNKDGHFKRVNSNFVHEGNNLSFSNSAIKGAKALDLKPKDKFVFLGMDNPFLYDLERILKDPDAENFDIILDCNSHQNMFKDDLVEFPHRNYHYRFKNGSQVFDAKEPNAYIFSNEAIEFMNLFYENRKDGGIYNALSELAFGREAKNSMSLLGKIAKAYVNESSLPEKTRKFFRWVKENKFFIFEQSVMKNLGKKYNNLLASNLGQAIYQFLPYHWKDPNICRGDMGNLEGAVSDLFGLKVRVKAEHNFSGRVNDNDAVEDIEFNEALYQYNLNTYGSLERICPFYNEVNQFLNEAMPSVRDNVKMYKVGFYDMFNKMSQDLGYKSIYDSSGNLITNPLSETELEVITIQEERKLNELKTGKKIDLKIPEDLEKSYSKLKRIQEEYKRSEIIVDQFSKYVLIPSAVALLAGLVKYGSK